MYMRESMEYDIIMFPANYVKKNQLSTNLSSSGRAQGSTQKLQQQTGEKSPIMTSQKGKGEQFRVASLIPSPSVGQLGADRKSQTPENSLHQEKKQGW